MYTNVGWFSHAHLIFNPILKLIFTMRTDWHLYMWKPNWKLTSSSHVRMKTNSIFNYIYIYGKLDMFFYKILIHFLEFLYQLFAPFFFPHMGLLFFSCWYYSFPFIAITFLFTIITLLPLLLFFSYCYYSSHMVLLFSCDEVIKLLKFILINGNFNNKVVKTGCEN
jgi:hypothetical protein